MIAPPHRGPVNLQFVFVEQFLYHGDIDTVQDSVFVGTPVVDEVIDNFRAEFEGRLVECCWNVLIHVTIR